MSAGRRSGAPRLLAAVVTLLLLASASATAAEDDARITARSPVVVDGAGEAFTANGSAALVTSRTGDDGVWDFTFDARDVHVAIHQTRAECTSDDALGATDCLREMYAGDYDRAPAFRLTDARAVAPGVVRDDFLASLTVDTQEGGREFDDAAAAGLRLAHADGRGEIVTAEEAPMQPYATRGQAPTGPTSPGAYSFSAYRSESAFAYRGAGDVGASVDGGWVKVYVFGADVRLAGTREDGSAFDEVIQTGRVEDENGVWTRHLVIESPDGLVDTALERGEALLTGPFEATAFDAVRFSDAEGTLTAAGRTYTFDRENAMVQGAFTLVPETVTYDESDGDARISLRVTGTSTILPAGVPAPDANPFTTTQAAAAAAAGLVLVGAAYYWPYLRYAAFGLVAPFYTRIQRDDVLSHDTRDQIFQLITTEPGIHAHAIGARAGIGWGTTVYHLRLLEEHRLVTSKRVGRYRRFYTVAGASPNRKEAYAVLRNDTSRDVGAFIVKNPGCAQKEVCEALDISPSLANWHVGKLENADLVKKVRQGRKVHYYAGPAWNEIDLAAVAPGLAAEGQPLVQLAKSSDDSALAGGEN